MFAIVQVGSLQYKITEGDQIEVNRLQSEEGKSLTLDQVLLYSNEKDVRVGQPYLKDVKVTAEVVKKTRGEKVVAFKFRRRKGYSRKVGHRQDLTVLNIKKISA